MFDILPTDELFADSPDGGTPECACSRCGKVIEQGPAIRAWDEKAKGEYRYHPACVNRRALPIDDVRGNYVVGSWE